jgi:hypothetical protein
MSDNSSPIEAAPPEAATAEAPPPEAPAPETAPIQAPATGNPPGPQPPAEAARRRAELLRRVREANQQSTRRRR